MSSNMKDHYSCEETEVSKRNSYSEVQRDCELVERKPSSSIVNWKSVSWTCYNCKEVFKQYKTFRDHQQSLHKINKSETSYHQCNDCSEPLLGYSSFLNHMRSIHHEVLKLCCDVCSEILPDFEKLSIHRDKHVGTLNNIHPVVYHCTLCEKVHSKEKELKTHIQQVHTLFSSTTDNEDSSFKVKGEEEERLQSSENFLIDCSTEPNQCKDEYNEVEITSQCGKCDNRSEIDADLKEAREDLKMSTEDTFEDIGLDESRPNTFSWNEMQHLELITAVEANPALWDVSTIEYRSAMQKSSFWQVVANAVSGMPSVDACKKKWKSLRVQYARILKTKNTKKSGQSNDETIKITWRYFEPMNFLQASVATNTTESESNVSALLASSPSNETMIVSPIPSPVSMISTTSKTSKQKRKVRTVIDSDSEDVVKQQATATGNFHRTIQVQQQSLNDEHQRFCDMLADELRRAYYRNPEGAQQLRQNLMITVTKYWQNEPP